MNFNKLFIAVLGLILFNSDLQSQKSTRSNHWCGSDLMDAEMVLKKPVLIQEEKEVWKQVRAYINNHPRDEFQPESAPYIIPLVFHCITDNGAGYVSNADVDDAVLTLNEDFNRTNEDTLNTRPLFRGVAGKMNIQFRLAQKDPNGNCTEGIVRADSPLSSNQRDAVKAVSHWSSENYLNIWVVNSIRPASNGGIFEGYAYPPTNGVTSDVFGVVIISDEIGRNKRVLTHEIGHCFGLDHIFAGGCGSDCTNSGDQLCDTPPSLDVTQLCDLTKDECLNDHVGNTIWGGSGNIVYNQIENYMGYDDCQNMFTKEQITAMEFYLNSTDSKFGLSRLTNSANWNLTGVNDPYAPNPCAPVTDFTYDTEFICEGDSVVFDDRSYGGIPNAWNWTFTGGTPNLSIIRNPTILYNTVGVYDVSAQSSSSIGIGQMVTKTKVITVSSLAADYASPLIEGFEDSTVFKNDWYVFNSIGQGFTFERSSKAPYTGSFSTRINNFNNDGMGVHEFISPSYDLSVMPLKKLKFKQAFTTKDGAGNDRLLLFYSKDCGRSWSLLLPILTSSELTTASDSKTSFIPANNGEWKERIVDLTSFGSEKNIRFKFQFTEGGGNNLYIDDINIGNATVGLEDFRNIASFNVYPNPTSSSAQISFNLLKDVSQLRIKVKNAIGQEVTNVIAGQAFNKGKYTLRIDKQRKLASGIYFIEFNADNHVRVQKLIIQ